MVVWPHGYPFVYFFFIVLPPHSEESFGCFGIDDWHSKNQNFCHQFNTVASLSSIKSMPLYERLVISSIKKSSCPTGSL
ncbi:UNVERIFIED_CONTAM: hypothetical protein ABID98_002728 [Brevibacillus sp. OAP136]